ncbi:MAG: hypothetical protein FJ135_05315 [Deltaproteobacteria bacterium]|nr:hypothetical protein [Deltaproteobacteria bacterium]
MARYRVRPGYCLHLPHQAFAQAGEEVELSGELEKEIIESQGWKIDPVNAGIDPGKPKDTRPDEKEVTEPPQDRAIKEAKAK